MRGDSLSLVPWQSLAPRRFWSRVPRSLLDARRFPRYRCGVGPWMYGTTVRRWGLPPIPLHTVPMYVGRCDHGATGWLPFALRIVRRFSLVGMRSACTAAVWSVGLGTRSPTGDLCAQYPGAGSGRAGGEVSTRWESTALVHRATGSPCQANPVDRNPAPPWAAPIAALPCSAPVRPLWSGGLSGHGCQCSGMSAGDPVTRLPTEAGRRQSRNTLGAHSSGIG